MSNVLRITGDTEKVRKRAAFRDAHTFTGRTGGTVPGARAVSGQRVRVTRTDVGTRNARLTATAAERAPHGARNAWSDAASVRNAKGEPFRFGVTSNAHNADGHDVGRSSFGDEAGSEPGPRHWHRHADGTPCDCPHARD